MMHWLVSLEGSIDASRLPRSSKLLCEKYDIGRPVLTFATLPIGTLWSSPRRAFPQAGHVEFESPEADRNLARGESAEPTMT